MIRSEAEEDKVHDQFKHLQNDWSSSKKWRLHCPHWRSAGAEIIRFMETPPRELISSIQNYSSPSNGWKVRTNDLAIQEIIRERRAAIKSGKLKGRRLFDALEGAGESNLQEEERYSHSACSSIMIHGSEVKSLCSYSSSSSSSDGDDNGDEAKNGDGCDDCACVENVEREMVVGLEGKGGISVGNGGGLWCMVRIAWVVFGVVIFALVKSFDERQDGERLIPT